jgi:hypothetical protein
MVAALKYRLFRLREAIRLSPLVSKTLYMAQNIKAVFSGRLLAASVPPRRAWQFVLDFAMRLGIWTNGWLTTKRPG